MIKTLHGRLRPVELFIAQTALWVMVGLIFSAGFARLLGHPINWAIDVSTCLFAWACFLSADIAWRDDKLMNVDVLVRRFPENLRQRLRWTNYVILIAFLLYLIFFGAWLSYTTRARSFQGIPGFSYTWVTLSIPVGSLCLLLTTIVKLTRDLGRKPAEAAGGSAARARTGE
jgi:TRAP-type C4-dicarboxylate transport system permease small subunit